MHTILSWRQSERSREAERDPRSQGRVSSRGLQASFHKQLSGDRSGARHQAAFFNGGVSCASTAISKTSVAFEVTRKRRKSFPSETRVKRGRRFVHGDVELTEKLGRNDLCPCGSGRRFQGVLPRLRPPRRRQPASLLSGSDRSYPDGGAERRNPGAGVPDFAGAPSGLRMCLTRWGDSVESGN
ncbi:MAG TPA: SEC-C metal-binding domain-containing protein [Xanthobacteraceae bacterium]